MLTRLKSYGPTTFFILFIFFKKNLLKKQQTAFSAWSAPHWRRALEVNHDHHHLEVARTGLLRCKACLLVIYFLVEASDWRFYILHEGDSTSSRHQMQASGVRPQCLMLWTLNYTCYHSYLLVCGDHVFIIKFYLQSHGQEQLQEKTAQWTLRITDSYIRARLNP